MYFVNFTNKKFNNTLTSNLTSGGQIIGSDVNGLPFLSSSGTQKPVSSTALSATPSGVQANQRLNSLSASVSVPRYSPITDDQGISLGQLQGFFSFVTWFTLLVVIIMSGLGIGVLFE